jgi:hypothetical protein
MENGKQTAIDWLIVELGEYFPHEIGGIHLMVEKAKQMEKEQIKTSFEFGEDNIDSLGYYVDNNGSENYYNETYGTISKIEKS